MRRTNRYLFTPQDAAEALQLPLNVLLLKAVSTPLALRLVNGRILVDISRINC